MLPLAVCGLNDALIAFGHTSLDTRHMPISEITFMSSIIYSNYDDSCLHPLHLYAICHIRRLCVLVAMCTRRHEPDGKEFLLWVGEESLSYLTPVKGQCFVCGKADWNFNNSWVKWNFFRFCEAMKKFEGNSNWKSNEKIFGAIKHFGKLFNNWKLFLPEFVGEHDESAFSCFP